MWAEDWLYLYERSLRILLHGSCSHRWCGPAGLSAALFTAKNDLATILFDTDQTWLHSSYLFNYLGIESIDGDESLGVARN